MAKNYKINTGSKPHLTDGTIISVIFRDGSTSFGEVQSWYFGIDGDRNDIIFYKKSTKEKYVQRYIPNKGSCPVPEGTMVDAIHRDGEVFKSVVVGKHGAVMTYNWKGDGTACDIIFWRLSKPKKEKE